MENIDNIFRKSEYQKELEVRPELWNRLERRLDNKNEPQKPYWPNWMVAASVTVVFVLSALLYLNIDSYEVEDMTVRYRPNFSKEEIAGLEKVYWITPNLYVNPDLAGSSTDLKG